MHQFCAVLKTFVMIQSRASRKTVPVGLRRIRIAEEALDEHGGRLVAYTQVVGYSKLIDCSFNSLVSFRVVRRLSVPGDGFANSLLL